MCCTSLFYTFNSCVRLNHLLHTLFLYLFINIIIDDDDALQFRFWPFIKVPAATNLLLWIFLLDLILKQTKNI